MAAHHPQPLPEDAGAADLIAGGRLQLGISRGSPEQVVEGYKYFGHDPGEGGDHAEMAREHTQRFLRAIDGDRFAEPNPRPMFPNPPGLLGIEPQSPGLRERIWWGAGTRGTAVWTAEQGMHLMSSTLLTEDTGVPFHQLQAEQQNGCKPAHRARYHKSLQGLGRQMLARPPQAPQTYFHRGSLNAHAPLMPKGSERPCVCAVVSIR